MVAVGWLVTATVTTQDLTGSYDTTKSGDFLWPPLGTATWPPVGTFSWPRTDIRHHRFPLAFGDQMFLRVIRVWIIMSEFSDDLAMSSGLANQIGQPNDRSGSGGNPITLELLATPEGHEMCPGRAARARARSPLVE